jgi:hypothetical protein
MTTEARLLFVLTFQRCCQHQRSAGRLYRALAAREQSVGRRTLLLELAVNTEQHARRYAMRLEQYGMPVITDQDSLSARLWRWVLVRCGATCALAWTEWVESHDRRLLVMLLTRFAPARSSLGADVSFLQEKRER